MMLRAQHIPVSVGTFLNKSEQLSSNPASWQDTNMASSFPGLLKQGREDSQRILNSSG